MNIFIDDIRNPSTVGLADEDYLVVRDYNSTIQAFISNEITFASFDHDLGEAETGYDIVKSLISLDLENMYSIFPRNFKFKVHSMNPIGKVNIETMLNNYLEFRGNLHLTSHYL